MIKNYIRKFFSLPFAENFLAKKTRGKNFDNIFVKLLPLNTDYKSNYLRKAVINGIVYELDLRQWMEYVFYFGIQTDNKHQLFKLVKPGDVVFDVGTNFGETLLQFAKQVSKTGSVVGFEPVPYIYNKCLKNLHLNNFENCVIENKALSDVHEWLTINDPLNNNSGGIFLTKNTDGEKVEAIRLDDYCIQKNIQKIDLIKIDVEGFEFNVLKGAVETLKKFRPVLFVEMIDENLQKQNASSTMIFEFLKLVGYNSFVDNETGIELKIYERLNLKTDVICKCLSENI